MDKLSLRLRVFLFFCLIALGSLVVILLALWLGYRQLDMPDALSSFITSGIVAGLGCAGLAVSIWLLFDENVSKPIEALAGKLRVQTHAGVPSEIDPQTAKYLGDLAPAAAAIGRKLGLVSQEVTETLEQQTARLKRQRSQLLQVLSDIPMAIIVAGPDHQIVLYDGQAAALMEQESSVRLGGSVLDYLDEGPIAKALEQLKSSPAMRRPIAVAGQSGAVYSGHIRLFGQEQGYTLMLEPLDPEAERPPICDLDLLYRSQPVEMTQAALRDLTFVVFDTETTGLDPTKDSVVQVGAVRVVNAKRVAGEEFDTLVNPGVPIPPASTKVHRIDDAMVQGAPDFDTVCGKFHTYTKGAVIVAHNAAFDMAFLHGQSKRTGLDFDHPILDTVHLSAAVFGASDVHTLDALCERLDVTIPAEHRHTALGDAVATADALIAMIPVLEARGFHTLGDVQAEILKHDRITRGGS